tara:strand:+ start:31 stop:468 length:438 start_codon:yes stop_codon:yes gene_type:complete
MLPTLEKSDITQLMRDRLSSWEGAIEDEKKNRRGAYYLRGRRDEAASRLGLPTHGPPAEPWQETCYLEGQRDERQFLERAGAAEVEWSGFEASIPDHPFGQSDDELVQRLLSYAHLLSNHEGTVARKLEADFLGFFRPLVPQLRR